MRSLVERFDVADGRRLLGPATLANRQTSELLSMSGGRMLTASDGRLVIRDAATYTPLSRWDIRPGALAAHACQVAGGA